MYESEGGSLTQDFVVGNDLLESSPDLQERRDQQFLLENCLSRIFSHTVRPQKFYPDNQQNTWPSLDII